MFLGRHTHTPKRLSQIHLFPVNSFLLDGRFVAAIPFDKFVNASRKTVTDRLAYVDERNTAKEGEMARRTKATAQVKMINK
jgi:hypothetical protein